MQTLYVTGNPPYSIPPYSCSCGRRGTVSGADGGSAVDVAIPAGRTLGVVRETARLLADERLRAPDEAGVLAFPVRKFAFGRADTWFKVGSRLRFHDGFS
jgi:hypothetical protein